MHSVATRPATLRLPQEHSRRVGLVSISTPVSLDESRGTANCAPLFLFPFAFLWCTAALDRLYLKPVLAITSDNEGTATWSEVKRTVSTFFRGQKEVFRSNEPTDSTSSSESESEGSQILLDAIGDVFSGDIAGSFGGWELPSTADSLTVSGGSSGEAAPPSAPSTGSSAGATQAPKLHASAEPAVSSATAESVFGTSPSDAEDPFSL